MSKGISAISIGKIDLAWQSESQPEEFIMLACPQRLEVENPSEASEMLITSLRHFAEQLESDRLQSERMVAYFQAYRNQVFDTASRNHIYLPDTKDFMIAGLGLMEREYVKRCGMATHESVLPKEVKEKLFGISERRIYRTDPPAMTIPEALDMLLSNFPPQLARKQAMGLLAGALWSTFWLSREDGIKTVAGYVVLTLHCGTPAGRLEYPNSERLEVALNRLAEVTAQDDVQAIQWQQELGALWDHYRQAMQPGGRNDFPSNPVAKVIFYKSKTELRITALQATRLNTFFAEHLVRRDYD